MMQMELDFAEAAKDAVAEETKTIRVGIIEAVEPGMLRHTAI